MSEALRRLRYSRNRVLIEASRILDPQFPAAIVHLSGAQIELLRNMTHYLNRPSTYVAEYESGSYLIPTDEDWDTLSGIVHDMEEKLMGNENTIWGISEVWSKSVQVESVGAGFTDASTIEVPEGNIYVVEYWEYIHRDTVPRDVSLRVYGGQSAPFLDWAPNANPAVNYFHETRLTLEAGEIITMRVYILANTKTCTLTVRGYKMAVPVVP